MKYDIIDKCYNCGGYKECILTRIKGSEPKLPVCESCRAEWLRQLYFPEK
jgi:hypothetical protein